MKSRLCSLGALFLGISVFGQQHQHEPLLCGTPDISFEKFQEPILFVQSMKASGKTLNATTSGTRYVPVKMHLLGNDDGTKRANDDAINNMLATLNKTFKANNIEFYFAGTSFNKYNNTKVNNREEDEKTFHETNGVKDAINLYVSANLGRIGGYTFITPTSQIYNRIHIINAQVNEDKTTPNEFGHYFGLLHTFQNSEANNPNGTPNWKKRELVTRLTNEVGSRLSANCDKAGDLLCDTEADPFGVEGYSVNSCVVTAPLDANGDTYRPNMGNYMNYNWCPDYNFTK